MKAAGWSARQIPVLVTVSTCDRCKSVQKPGREFVVEGSVPLWERPSCTADNGLVFQWLTMVMDPGADKTLNLRDKWRPGFRGSFSTTISTEWRIGGGKSLWVNG